MTKDEMIQEMIEIAAHNMDWFIGIIGVTVALFALFQWRYTDQQVKKMKSEILKQVDNLYKSRIETLENNLKQYKKYQNNTALWEANELNNKFFGLTTSDDYFQQSEYRNEINATINHIFKNNIITDDSKIAVMMIVVNCIRNAKRVNQENKVNSIYQFIVNDSELKRYFTLAKVLLDENSPNETINNNGK